MTRYRNISGNSGVVAYEIHPRSVIVQFQDGEKYEYTVGSAGTEAVRMIKQLAVAGQGLSGYIAQHVRDAYARKFR
jgi:hypothetical protein